MDALFLPELTEPLTRVAVGDPVCRCGHGRSVHGDDVRARCRACLALHERLEPLPAGVACAAFWE